MGWHKEHLLKRLLPMHPRSIEVVGLRQRGRYFVYSAEDKPKWASIFGIMLDPPAEHHVEVTGKQCRGGSAIWTCIMDIFDDPNGDPRTSRRVPEWRDSAGGNWQLGDKIILPSPGRRRPVRTSLTEWSRGSNASRSKRTR